MKAEILASKCQMQFSFEYINKTSKLNHQTHSEANGKQVGHFEKRKISNMSCAVPTQAWALKNNDGMTSADVLQEAAPSTLLQLHGREPSDTEQRGENGLKEQPIYQSLYSDGDRQFHSRSLVNIPSALKRDNAISANYTSIPQRVFLFVFLIFSEIFFISPETVKLVIGKPRVGINSLNILLFFYYKDQNGNCFTFILNYA